MVQTRGDSTLKEIFLKSRITSLDGKFVALWRVCKDLMMALLIIILSKKQSIYTWKYGTTLHQVIRDLFVSITKYVLSYQKEVILDSLKQKKLSISNIIFILWLIFLIRVTSLAILLLKIKAIALESRWVTTSINLLLSFNYF